MVDASEAVEIAQSKLPKVVPAFAALEPFVEEVEQSKDGQVWLITFRAKNPEPDGGEGTFGGQIFVPFIDKEVRIAISDGDLLAVVNPKYR